MTSSPSIRPDRPVIEMLGIVKEFPGVRALNEMSFEVYKGEVHCLVGETGAVMLAASMPSSRNL